MLVASDIDNTLIHSYKAAKAGDICVEIKDGKELSFMPRETYTLLKDIVSKCLFVPVTTRSLEQYLRLDLGVKLKYAVVAHGALLLIDGKADEQWAIETKLMLNDALPKLDTDKFLFDIRYVENFFIFAKSDYPLQAVKHLQSIVDEKQFDVCAVHNKVYVFPAGLNKGIAVKRLMERLMINRIVCAGDSVLDIPMLAIADAAIIPQTLALRREHLYVLPSASFTSEALKVIQELIINLNGFFTFQNS